MTNTTAIHPQSLADLAMLDRASLKQLHSSGSCRDPSAFAGAVDGMILGGSLLAKAGIWRGKHFEQFSNGGSGGWNRIGFGPLEFKRYRFIARTAQSHFSDREVLFLDHDQEGNPAWVRSFHDELVELESGLYLATSHQWAADKLRFRAYFALALNS